MTDQIFGLMMTEFFVFLMIVGCVFFWTNSYSKMQKMLFCTFFGGSAIIGQIMFIYQLFVMLDLLKYFS